MTLPRLVFRAALLAIPSSLRAGSGAEMEALFEANYTAARRRGRLPAIAVTLAAALDALAFGLSRRRTSAFRRRGARHQSGSRTMTLDLLWHDTRQIVRSLRKAPRYTLTATLTLALGIGANAAIFSVVYGVILRPLPFPEPNRVVHIGWQYDGGFGSWLTAWQYEFWRDHTDVFEAVTTYRGFSDGTGPDERGPLVHGLRVSDQFLEVTGVQPVIGRSFAPEDEVPGAPDVIIIGYRRWHNTFDASDSVLGQTLVVGGRPRTIVGVLPESFEFPQAVGHADPAIDALLPLGLRADPQDEGQNYQFLGRLRDGVDLAAADAQVRAVTAAFQEAHPDLMLGDTMRLSSYQEIFVGGLRSTLLKLMAAIGLVLLIACANVANLNLARAADRAREVAIRTALGATRGRIAGHVLGESLLIATIGGMLSLVVAPWVTNLLLAVSPSELPRVEQVSLSWTVVGFTFAATLVAGLAVGVMAAWTATRREMATRLRDGDRGGSRQGRVRQIIVGAEAALAMVLLVSAGLLISTVRELYRVDPGFDRDGLVTARFEESVRGYDDPLALADLGRQVIDGLAGHPAVAAVAGASSLPLERGWNIPVTITGRPDASEGAVEWRGVSQGYVEALGMRLVRGRSFTAADNRAGSPPVAIVNEAFATRYFPDEDPLGQRLEIGKFRGRLIHPSYAAPPAEIIGIVADVQDMSLKTDPKRTVLMPHAHTPSRLLTTPVFLVRGSGVPRLSDALQTAIGNVDPGLPSVQVRPMDDIVAASVARERFNALLMSTFAGLALVLTVIGIYGVVAYDVRKRAREIGIRMALGARAPDVVRLAVRRGITPVILGLVAGTVAALMLSRLIANMLWGVNPTDPVVVSLVAGLLAGAAILASYLPARHAATGDPRMALLEE